MDQEPTRVGGAAVAALRELTLEPPIVEYLRSLDSPVVGVSPVREVPRAGDLAGPHQLLLADGRQFKLTVSAPGKPKRAADGVRALGMSCFPPILAHGTRTLLTPWIPGEPLADPPTESVVERCAELHATIHRRPVPLSGTHRRSVAEWSDWLRATAAELLAAGLLDVARARAVLDRAEQEAPAGGEYTWIHRDFCAENMITDRAGELRVIDNESIELGIPEYDLARTWVRWPMSPEMWDCYLARYSTTRSTERFRDELGFWSAVALLGSVYSRWRTCRQESHQLVDRWLALGRPRSQPAAPTADLGLAATYCRSGLTLRIDFSDRSDRSWLDRFVHPWFVSDGGDDPGPPTRSEAQLSLVRDRKEFELLRDTCLSGADQLVRAFTLDNGFVELPARRDPPGLGGLVVYDRKFDCAVLVRGAAGGQPVDARVVAAPGNARARLTLMRVAREYLLQHLAAVGSLVVHAAAVGFRGRTLLLAGPKQSGKTTALSWLLGAEPEPGSPLTMVSNDRVEILRDGNIEARGIPTIVSIRPGALRLVDSLRQALSDGFADVALEGPSARRRWRASDDERPLHMSPREYCRLLGREPDVGGPIGAILLVDRCDRGPEPCLTVLAGSSARRRIENCVLRAPDHLVVDGGSTVFVPASSEPRSPDRPSVAELVDKIPVLGLGLGPAALATSTGVQMVERALESSGSTR